MIRIVSKIKIDGVERDARLFKAEKYYGGPTLWVVTNAHEFILQDSFTYRWKEDRNQLEWDTDYSNGQVLHDIATGILTACEAAGIPVE